MTSQGLIRQSIVLQELVACKEDVLHLVEVMEEQVASRYFLSDVEHEGGLCGIWHWIHAGSERQQVLTISSSENRMPRRCTEANLLSTEVNPHMEDLNDWPPHQHGSVAGDQVALDGAVLAVDHDRKVNCPASGGGSIATKLKISLTASEPDSVHWISKLAQVLHIAPEGTIAAQKGGSTRVQHRCFGMILSMLVLKKDQCGLRSNSHSFSRRTWGRTLVAG